MAGLIAIGAVALAYALLARRLDRLSIGAPLVFLTTGIVLGVYFPDDVRIEISSELVRTIAEVTLALLLFTDASTVGLSALRKDAAIPARLLLIGLPLTIALGALIAHQMFAGATWGTAALAAAILAPTDAALSLPVVTNPAVPTRVRRVLNVESGLNDGIATPIVVVLIAVVASEEHATSGWLTHALKAIAIAVVVAIVLGYGVGRLVRRATESGWMTNTSHQLTVLVLALLCYLTAVEFDGNGFVAAFVGGLLFGWATRYTLHEATEFTETTGMFLSFAVWAIFGVVLAAPALKADWTWQPLVYAVLSLTVIRMLPVALSLIGVALRPMTVGFIGWFGPRGLASVVFLVLALDGLDLTVDQDPIVQTVAWTIVLSVVLHGLTAGPFAARYGRRIGAVTPRPPELDSAAEPRVRRRSIN